MIPAVRIAALRSADLSGSQAGVDAPDCPTSAALDAVRPDLTLVFFNPRRFEALNAGVEAFHARTNGKESLQG
jgi:hypothetical protein